jgi:hypothetical protein
MEKVIQVLNQMQADGVIEHFAIGGGIAAIRYLEAYETDDIDVFLSPVVIGDSGLISLGSIYSYLGDLGYPALKEGILIEDWLVQFVPASESVQEEAVAEAQRVPFGKSYTRVFSAEHLAAELLRSGRPKDYARVLALIELDQFDMAIFKQILTRHNLDEKWKAFAKRFDLEG